MRFEDVDPQGRELWFVTDVVLGDAAGVDPAPLGVAIGGVAASEVFWNGERIGANGVPGSSRATERPGALDAIIYLPPRLAEGERHELLVHLSGFHNRLRLTTPMHYLLVTDYSILGLRTPYYLPSVLMAGALLAALAWFGGAWWRERRDTASLLVVAMAACALGQLGTEVWRGLWPLPYHWQAGRLVAIQCLATGFALSLVAYVTGRFAMPWRRRALLGTGAMPILTLAVPGYDVRTLVTLALPLLLVLVLTVPAARRGARGARPLVAAFVLFLALLAVDTWGFVDRGFYLGTAALTLVLVWEQWRAGAQAEREALLATRRAARLEVELLRRRFAPHWLLNTLNSLTDWIESEPRTAVRLIEALGEQYHMVAEMSGQALVPLDAEVALCRKHLEVMSLRVDRAFHLECHGVDLTRQVPPGVVQTLVENAFTHGRQADGAVFVLREAGDGDEVTLEVLTPVPEGVPRAAPHRHHGEGMDYVRAQMHNVFGAASRVEDGPTEAGGWCTRLVLGRAT